MVINQLYEDPNVTTERLLAEVLNAAEDYPSGLASDAVITRIEALLGVAESWLESSTRVDPRTVARATVDAARRSAIDAGETSIFGDLADKAVHYTLLSTLGDSGTSVSSAGALQAFVGNLVAAAVDHLVSRDLSAHMGRGRITGATAANDLRREVVSQARSLAEEQRFSAIIARASETPRNDWQTAIRSVWEYGEAVPQPRPERGRQ
jgi:hypothetical protein